MNEISKETAVAVVGAGAMGAGIAQVAATAGHRVALYDMRDGAAASAIQAMASAFDKLVEKGKYTRETVDGILARLSPAASLDALADAGLIVEAIKEDLEVKRSLFADLEAITSPQAILASNTSSLSITAIAAGMKHPERMAGLHFFNPAPILPLVEVITGLATDPAVAQALLATAKAWGKFPVLARSTPGFIVNRVARPFYGEGLRLLQEGAAAPAVLDALVREGFGFRMGPFELMDLIGHDVNFAVTSSIHAAYFGDPRFTPSVVQRELVEAGWFGRKSGRGFYDYAAGAQTPAVPSLEGPAPSSIEVAGDLGPAAGLVDRLQAAGISPRTSAGAGVINLPGATLALSDGRTATERAAVDGLSNLVLFDLIDFAKGTRIALAKADGAPASALAEAAGLFKAAGLAATAVDDTPGLVNLRTLSMLINEAAEAVLHGVASAADVDTAMMKGVNYPKGLLALADEVGARTIVKALDNLARTYGEDRYRASSLLRRMSVAGRRFHEGV